MYVSHSPGPLSGSTRLRIPRPLPQRCTMTNILIPVFPSAPPFLTSWIPGQTPMSTWTALSTGILSYLAIVFGLQEFMKDRPAFKLRKPFRIHNAFLSLSSLVLLALMIEEVTKLWYHAGAYGAFCASASWTRRLEFYYMINYYFKYIEFLDTVFLVLKKRPLSFLHVFHHSTTALLTFVQIEAKLSGAWSVICLNLGVHVVMYYYYFAAAGGAKLWWKKHLTTMQILQFIIDIFLFHFGLYQHFAFTYWPYLPHIGDCAGDSKTAIFADVLIMSFLGLFANFYVQTYTKTDGDGIGKDTARLQVMRNNPGSGRRTD
ncbi:GNS1/SUR4 family-domain-containing protein [Boletus coccyginus]|nr:GNS1/SUR4 family-domain-containing protein [Boletus coccyginus]